MKHEIRKVISVNDSSAANVDGYNGLNAHNRLRIVKSLNVSRIGQGSVISLPVTDALPFLIVSADVTPFPRKISFRLFPLDRT